MQKMNIPMNSDLGDCHGFGDFAEINENQSTEPVCFQQNGENEIIYEFQPCQFAWLYTFTKINEERHVVA